MNAKGDFHEPINNVLTRSDAEARKRREVRESKPVREWTAEERCEAFREARRIERERAEAGIVEEWELCETCHDYKHEQGLLWCKRCIEQADAPVRRLRLCEGGFTFKKRPTLGRLHELILNERNGPACDNNARIGPESCTYTDENFCAVGRLIPVASLDRDTRRGIGDCDLVGSDPEATLRARDNLDCDRTLLPAGDSFGWYCGYFGYGLLRGNHRFWVWVLPTLYLAMKIILWTPTTVLVDHNWHTTFAHFFVGTPPRYPEGNITIPFYTTLSYAFGALLDAGNVLRFQRPSEGAAD
jgi:hypothetical protein